MRIQRCVAAVALLIGLGCGNESGGGADGSSEVGQTFSQEVVAAQGGAVSTDSGSASVAIPGDALVADTEITITVAQRTGEAQTDVYDMGPDGLFFLEPVTISIRYDVDPGAGRAAVLAVREGGSWVQVPASHTAGGLVIGEVTHFSEFTVIVVGESVVVQSACEDYATGYSACGGSLTGSWEYRDICFEDVFIDTESEVSAICAEAVGAVELIAEGTIEIDDSTMTYGNETMTLRVTGLVPLACLEDTACSDVPSEALTDDWSCSVVGGACQCRFEDIWELPTNPVPYTLTDSGTGLEFDHGDWVERMTFCVQGDDLVIAYDMSQIGDDYEGWPVLYYVFDRVE